jgi:hypothetical protein
LKEINQLKSYTRKHPRDHSGFHYLSTLIETLSEFHLEFNSLNEILLDLFFHCQLLIIYFPGHESIWLFRRFLFQFLINHESMDLRELKIENKEYEDECKCFQLLI